MPGTSVVADGHGSPTFAATHHALQESWSLSKCCRRLITPRRSIALEHLLDPLEGLPRNIRWMMIVQDDIPARHRLGTSAHLTSPGSVDVRDEFASAESVGARVDRVGDHGDDGAVVRGFPADGSSAERSARKSEALVQQVLGQPVDAAELEQLREHETDKL